MVAVHDRSFTLARWLSRVFHPFWVAIFTLAVALSQNGTAPVDTLGWVGLSAGVVILPTAVFILLRVWAGRYSNFAVSLREQRRSLYLFSTVCLVILVGVLLVGNPPVVLAACILAGFLANVTGGLLNQFTKVSVHSGAMAGCTTVLLILAPPVGAGMALVAVATSWSRLRLGQHTIPQILTGGFVAAVSVVTVFSFYNLI